MLVDCKFCEMNKSSRFHQLDTLQVMAHPVKEKRVSDCLACLNSNYCRASSEVKKKVAEVFVDLHQSGFTKQKLCSFFEACLFFSEVSTSNDAECKTFLSALIRESKTVNTLSIPEIHWNILRSYPSRAKLFLEWQFSGFSKMWAFKISADGKELIAHPIKSDEKPVDIEDIFDPRTLSDGPRFFVEDLVRSALIGIYVFKFDKSFSAVLGAIVNNLDFFGIDTHCHISQIPFEDFVNFFKETLTQLFPKTSWEVIMKLVHCLQASTSVASPFLLNLFHRLGIAIRIMHHSDFVLLKHKILSQARKGRHRAFVFASDEFIADSYSWVCLHAALQVDDMHGYSTEDQETMALVARTCKITSDRTDGFVSVSWNPKTKASPVSSPDTGLLSSWEFKLMHEYPRLKDGHLHLVTSQISDGYSSTDTVKQVSSTIHRILDASPFLARSALHLRKDMTLVAQVVDQ